MSPMPDFLDREQEVKIPTGGVFAPTGFVAQWMARVLHSFWTAAEFPEEDYPYIIQRKTQNGYFYYFEEFEKAKQAADDAGLEYPPRTVWHFTTPKNTVLNFFDEASAAKFRENIANESRVMTLRSNLHRHELHMISLPAIVAAMATLSGYENPGFDMSELLTQDAIFTDEFRAEMVGNPDVEGGYAHSTLWGRRAALWEALGEPNAKAYQPKNRGTRFDTTSDKLSACLSVLTSPWKGPIWGRLLFVPNPRVDAVYGDEGKRLTVPALTEIFADESAAKAAVEADRKEAEAKGGKPRKAVSAATIAAAGGISVPPAWEGLEEDWKATVQGVKAEFEGKPKPVIAKALRSREAELMEDYAASPDDFLKSWDEV